MSEIPIFDSLTHPMPDGNWLGDHYAGQNSIESLLSQMGKARIAWGLAVGMGKAVGSYEEETYAGLVISKSGGRLFPVAYLEYQDIKANSPAKLHSYFCKARETGVCRDKAAPQVWEFFI